MKTRILLTLCTRLHAESGTPTKGVRTLQVYIPARCLCTSRIEGQRDPDTNSSSDPALPSRSRLWPLVRLPLPLCGAGASQQTEAASPDRVCACVLERFASPILDMPKAQPTTSGIPQIVRLRRMSKKASKASTR